MAELSAPNSVPAGMPFNNQAVLGHQAGGGIHFPSFAAFTAAVTTGTAAYSYDLWSAGQKFSISGEPVNAVRFANGNDALSVLVGGAVIFRLGSLTNVVGTTSGAPSSGSGADGELRIDQATGLVHKKTSGAWDAGSFGFAVTAGAASTVVTTVLRHTTLSHGPVVESGSGPYTYTGGSGGFSGNYVCTPNASIPAGKDFEYYATVTQPTNGNQVVMYLSVTLDAVPFNTYAMDGNGGYVRVINASDGSVLNQANTVATGDILRIKRTNSSTNTNASVAYAVSHDSGATFTTTYTQTGQSATAILYPAAAFNGPAAVTSATLKVG